ncbi:MATE family efflux transporter [Williamsoniiplasma luminosum]|uniref:MATE family efflux transporter n=1 Tax=Williamsoniiplasma luminosum TaxID=214888 RepID=A0A2S0NJ02_9MOLU|nr:MATE family efflux transporter [Williamsoniiplasma luminosum]AVP48995.1 MAG: hypothetical protein C5T88_00100 [Williamsoniiplasma luminosum]
MKAKWNFDEQTLITINDNKQLDFLKNDKFYKAIWAMSLPIYYQMISTVILTIINSLIMRWIDGGQWSAVVNKINFAYSWVIFLPSFSSIGVFILIGNYLGQKRTDELHKVLFQGWLINIIIAILTITIMSSMKNQIFNWINLEKEHYEIGTILYWINLSVLFLNSINIVSQRAEAALGRTKTLFFILLASGVINTIFVLSLSWVIKPPIAIGIGSLVSTFIMSLVIVIYNSKKVGIRMIFTNTSKCFDSTIFKSMLIIGIPAAIETLIFNFTAAYVTGFITLASISYGEGDILFNTLNATQQIANFGLLMSVSLGQVSTIFISRLIGSNLFSWSKKIANKCWLLTLYVAMPFSILTIGLAWPLLSLYNIPTDIIWSIGIWLFVIIFFQDFGRTMNQIGLSCLRIVKYTLIPLIIAFFSLVIFNVGVVFLIQFLINIKEEGIGAIEVMNRAKLLILLIVMVQAIEEIIRGSAYWLIWQKNLWEKKKEKIYEKK